MDPSTQALRDALAAYIQTFPNDTHLETHIRVNGLADHAEQITSACNSAIMFSKDYLYAYPGGVPWTAA
jgi:hypothetical protein